MFGFEDFGKMLVVLAIIGAAAGVVLWEIGRYILKHLVIVWN